MLLSPIQYSMVSVTKETLLNEIPKVEIVLKETAVDLNSNNIEVKIENNKLMYSSTYQNYIEGYTIYIGDDYQEYPKVLDNEIQKTDNIIIFGETTFYARYITRNYDNKVTDTQSITGTYKLTNTFNFNLIFENIDNDQEIYNLVGALLRAIFLSNTSSNLIFWVLIIEMFNLLYILLGAFLLFFFNRRGNRDYKLTYWQVFLTVMGSLFFPSLVSSFVGMINFSYFTICYVLLAIIRLFMLCFIQLSKNNKYDQLKVHVSDENFTLNFK